MTNTGVFVGGQLRHGFLQEAARVLLGGRRVYRYGDTLVYESADEDDRRLTLLAVGGKAESVAAPLLANLLVAGVQRRTVHAEPAARQAVSALLASEARLRRLPAISRYTLASRLRRGLRPARAGLPPRAGHPRRRAGRHAGPRRARYAPDARAIDRLPRHLRRLLRDFLLGGDADLANAVFLLTRALANRFIGDPKPVAILDGNQRGLARRSSPRRWAGCSTGRCRTGIALTRDDELQKSLGARFRGPQCSLIFFDNVRDRIESAPFEADALAAPCCASRILGSRERLAAHSYLWVIMSNQTSGTEDLSRAACPSASATRATPRARLRRGPAGYVTLHRLDILGELAGMVHRWKSAGMPMGQRKAIRAGRRSSAGSSASPD